MTKTGMDPKSFSSPLPMRQVRIGESFWYREQEVVRTRILPYQWNALNDRIRSRKAGGPHSPGSLITSGATGEPAR